MLQEEEKIIEEENENWEEVHKIMIDFSEKSFWKIMVLFFF